MKKITVIGCGYVGLVTAACLAEVGHTVFCLDVDKRKISALQQGNVPIYEPGLDDLVIRNSRCKRLHFTTSYHEALLDTQLAMIAVDTPPMPDGSCDTRNLKLAAQTIGETITQDTAVVIKSTVPVGSAALVLSIISSHVQKKHPEVWCEVISNPEFLREGHAIEDFMHPDRIIIGLSSERAEEVMRTLYAPFHHDPKKFLFMDVASSELTKYAANSMLALRISFMNSLSLLCDATGADIESIKKGVGSDSRVGPTFLNAGCGYGGSCFPKDVKALEQMFLRNAIESHIVTAIDTTNEQQKLVLGNKIIAYFKERGGLLNKTIALLGLAFKPDTDDMREAPSLVLIQQLLAEGALVRVYDPAAMENTKKLLPPSSNIHFCTRTEDVFLGAHAIALVTEWPAFLSLDYTKCLKKMNGNAFFDGRNQFCPEKMRAQGFSYISIGRKPAYAEERVQKGTLSTSKVVVHSS